MVIQVNDDVYVNPLQIISIRKFDDDLAYGNKYIIAIGVPNQVSTIYQYFKTKEERDRKFHYLVDDLESALERLTRKN